MLNFLKKHWAILTFQILFLIVSYTFDFFINLINGDFNLLKLSDKNGLFMPIFVVITTVYFSNDFIKRVHAESKISAYIKIVNCLTRIGDDLQKNPDLDTAFKQSAYRDLSDSINYFRTFGNQEEIIRVNRIAMAIINKNSRDFSDDAEFFRQKIRKSYSLSKIPVNQINKFPWIGVPSSDVIEDNNITMP